VLEAAAAGSPRLSELLSSDLWDNAGGHAEEESKMQGSWIFLPFFWKHKLKSDLLLVFKKWLLGVRVKMMFQGRREFPKRWHSQARLSQTLLQQLPLKLFQKAPVGTKKDRG